MPIIEPNTPNQIKIRDSGGDELWADNMDDPDIAVVISTKRARGGWAAVALTHEDRLALIHHLTQGDSA